MVRFSAAAFSAVLPAPRGRRADKAYGSGNSRPGPEFSINRPVLEELLPCLVKKRKVFRMELLQLLESLEGRVNELLGQLEALREENRSLKETATGLAELREENRALLEALEQERHLRGEIEGRIDSLLSRLDGRLSSGN